MDYTAIASFLLRFDLHARVGFYGQTVGFHQMYCKSGKCDYLALKPLVSVFLKGMFVCYQLISHERLVGISFFEE